MLANGHSEAEGQAVAQAFGQFLSVKKWKAAGREAAGLRQGAVSFAPARVGILEEEEAAAVRLPFLVSSTHQEWVGFREEGEVGVLQRPLPRRRFRGASRRRRRWRCHTCFLRRCCRRTFRRRERRYNRHSRTCCGGASRKRGRLRRRWPSRRLDARRVNGRSFALSFS